jgi:hypothetical protein
MTTGIDFRRIYRELMAEERDTLISLGLDFLTERLAEVETRIERLNAYLVQHYPDQRAIPVIEAGRMQNYETERKLLKSLRLASQATPFIEVHRRRLSAARQRVTQLLGKGRGNLDSATRAKRYQAHLEQEILVELQVKWLIWLKPSRLYGNGR